MANENTVLTALSKFLCNHNLQDHISDIDDIVLSYVISILEDLGDSENAEENIDVDQFIEMMDAYIPGFATIDSVLVCDWMFELSATLRDSQKSDPSSREPIPPTIKSEIVEGACHIPIQATKPRTATRLDSRGDSERTSSESSIDEVDEVMQQLVEMFPGTVRIELEHCIHNASGDIEQAVQLVLHRQEEGLAITENKRTKDKRSHGYDVLDDKKSKEKLMEKYAFIDVDEDKKKYKPAVPKAAPKKMVRYLDNQVVNTKGQRFTEIKKDDSEEMKKTYINLKPARKYRFH